MFDFCLPTTSVPDTPDWLHEVKYDGYRLRLERDGDRVRLITRGGYNWTDRFPCIGEAALKNRVRQFVIDGEAVVLGVDGIADFDALHSGKHNEEVQLYAFDVLALDGDDLRRLPLSMRKTNLDRLLARRPDGIFAAPFEQARSGLICFEPRATWAGGAGVETARPALSGGPVQILVECSRAVSARSTASSPSAQRQALRSDTSRNTLTKIAPGRRTRLGRPSRRRDHLRPWRGR